VPEKATTAVHAEAAEIQSREMSVAIGDGHSFPALVDLGERWNGWLCPRFDRTIVGRVVDWLNGERATAPECDRPDYAHATWTGTTILLSECGDASAPERIEPDADGRYSLGAYSWCWEPVQQQEGTAVTDQPIKLTTLTALQVSALRELPLTDEQVTIGATVATFHMSAHEAFTLVTKGQLDLGLTQGTTRHPYKSLHGVVRKLRKLAQSSAEPSTLEV